MKDGGSLALSVGEIDNFTVGFVVGFGLEAAVGLSTGAAVGFPDGLYEGATMSISVGDGGNSVDPVDGNGVGDFVCSMDDKGVGLATGEYVGFELGSANGYFDGSALGSFVGIEVGLEVELVVELASDSSKGTKLAQALQLTGQ